MFALNVQGAADDRGLAVGFRRRCAGGVAPVNSPTWIDGLRLLSVVALAYGAWQGWRNRPPGVRLGRRKYYRLKDGRYASAWGRIVTDPALAEALRASEAGSPPSSP